MFEGGLLSLCAGFPKSPRSPQRLGRFLWFTLNIEDLLGIRYFFCFPLTG